MRAAIHRLCVCCSARETWYSSVRLVTYGPGSRHVAVWSYILAPKRKINIHTFCNDCRMKENLLSIEQESNVILKKRSNAEFHDRGPWFQRQWHFWMLSPEWQSLEDRLNNNKDLALQIRLHVTLE